jgi:hypothetical protein
MGSEPEHRRKCRRFASLLHIRTVPAIKPPVEIDALVSPKSHSVRGKW